MKSQTKTKGFLDMAKTSILLLVVFAALILLTLPNNASSQRAERSLKMYDQITGTSRNASSITKWLTTTSNLFAPVGECACSEAQIQACAYGGVAVRNWCLAFGGTPDACELEARLWIADCIIECDKPQPKGPGDN